MSSPSQRLSPTPFSVDDSKSTCIIASNDGVVRFWDFARFSKFDKIGESRVDDAAGAAEEDGPAAESNARSSLHLPLMNLGVKSSFCATRLTPDLFAISHDNAPSVSIHSIDVPGHRECARKPLHLSEVEDDRAMYKMSLPQSSGDPLDQRTIDTAIFPQFRSTRLLKDVKAGNFGGVNRMATIPFAGATGAELGYGGKLLLATVDISGSCVVWDVPQVYGVEDADGEPLFCAKGWRKKTGYAVFRQTLHSSPLSPYKNQSYALHYSHSMKCLAMGDDDGNLWTWDLLAGSQRRNFGRQTRSNCIVALSSLDKLQLLVAGGGPTHDAAKDNENSASLWDDRSVPAVRSLTSSNAGAFFAISTSGDKFVYAGEASGYIICWDVRKGNEPLWKARPHKSFVWEVWRVDDGRMLSASSDNFVRLWKPGPNAKVIKELKVGRKVYSAHYLGYADGIRGVVATDSNLPLELERIAFVQESGRLGCRVCLSGGSLLCTRGFMFQSIN